MENENYAFRIGHLRKTHAKVKFLSLEPLLGPLPNLNLKEREIASLVAMINTGRQVSVR